MNLSMDVDLCVKYTIMEQIKDTQNVLILLLLLPKLVLSQYHVSLSFVLYDCS